MGRFAEAVEIGERQLARTEAAGLGRWSSHLEQAALIHRMLTDRDRRPIVARAERALATHRTFRNRYQLHLAKALVMLELGELEEAARVAKQLGEERKVSPEATVVCGMLWAELAWHRDDLDLAHQALEVGRSAVDAYFGVHTLTERTVAHVRHGHGLAPEPVLPAISMPAWGPALIELDGLQRLAAGDHAAAEAALERAAAGWAGCLSRPGRCGRASRPPPAAARRPSRRPAESTLDPGGSGRGSGGYLPPSWHPCPPVAHARGGGGVATGCSGCHVAGGRSGPRHCRRDGRPARRVGATEVGSRQPPGSSDDGHTMRR